MKVPEVAAQATSRRRCSTLVEQLDAREGFASADARGGRRASGPRPSAGSPSTRSCCSASRSPAARPRRRCSTRWPCSARRSRAAACARPPRSSDRRAQVSDARGALGRRAPAEPSREAALPRAHARRASTRARADRVPRRGSSAPVDRCRGAVRHLGARPADRQPERRCSRSSRSICSDPALAAVPVVAVDRDVRPVARDRRRDRALARARPARSRGGCSAILVLVAVSLTLQEYIGDRDYFERLFPVGPCSTTRSARGTGTWGVQATCALELWGFAWWSGWRVLGYVDRSR